MEKKITAIWIVSEMKSRNIILQRRSIECTKVRKNLVCAIVWIKCKFQLIMYALLQWNEDSQYRRNRFREIWDQFGTSFLYVDFVLLSSSFSSSANWILISSLCYEHVQKNGIDENERRIRRNWKLKAVDDAKNGILSATVVDCSHEDERNTKISNVSHWIHDHLAEFDCRYFDSMWISQPASTKWSCHTQTNNHD